MGLGVYVAKTLSMGILTCVLSMPLCIMSSERPMDIMQFCKGWVCTMAQVWTADKIHFNLFFCLQFLETRRSKKICRFPEKHGKHKFEFIFSPVYTVPALS